MTIEERTHRQYRQTLIIGLINVVKELFPKEKLKIAYSILVGIYCELENSVLSSREVALIEQKLKVWMDSQPEISYHLAEDGFFHCTTGDQTIKSLYPPMQYNEHHYLFSLIYYAPGFILLFSSLEDFNEVAPFIPPEKLSTTFIESQRWLENLHLDQVGDVNTIISQGNYQELVSLAEAMHEKNVSLIADRILEQRRNIRIILISGPSSSGKTTFAQRLSTQLRVNGLRPVAISLDNYFLPREKTPTDAQGLPDFESIHALDLILLNQHVQALIHGETIESPVYNFVEGGHSGNGKTLTLANDEILVLEGIHGLNPVLLPSLERNQLFRIYVSALFQLNLDSYNRISTTEVRLIRRLVRDDKFRGFSPDKTLNQWASVRRGENHNIFPYQEEADVMFNSSLLYELNALRPYAEPLLIDIPEENPHQATATHLLRLLSHFEPLEVSKVPFNSILREFIGGGIYP